MINSALPQQAPALQPGIVTHSASPRQAYVTTSAVKRDPSELSNSAKADVDLLAKSHEDFRTCLTWENDWRRKAEMEIDFVDHLKHWDEQVLKDRQGRPSLVFDIIGPAIDQVVNDARQNPPEAKISPVGGGADQATADILQGVLRNIENDSEGEVADMTAYEWAVKVGRGWSRVLFDWETEDVSPDAFLQKITIGHVPNLFSIYPDPLADRFDYSDMRFCFVTEDMDRDTFRDLYPDSDICGMDSFEGIGDSLKANWFPKGNVRVAEYWWVEKEKITMCMLRNGQVVPENKVFGADVLAKRESRRNKVCCAKITGMEVLERTEWPGRWIPIIPIIGRQSIKNGRRTLRGMIRSAIDANLAYDFARSKEAEAISLAPISQWLVAEGQLEGHEYKWADANRKAFAYLEYKATDAEGKLVPAPIRVNAQPGLGAITGAIAHASQDGKEQLSTYAPQLGAPSSETSGKAILARQREGDNAHFNFHDNLSRYKRHQARVIIDLIPYVYNEARAITIFDPDQSSRSVKINQPTFEKGVQRIYNLADPAARFHVTIGTEPTYASRKAEQRALVVELSRTMPVLALKAPDLIAKALGLDEEFVERLRPAGLPPVNGEEPNVMQMQTQIQQQTEMIQQLTKAVNELSDKKSIEKMKLESAERRTDMDNRNDLLIAENSSKSLAAQLNSNEVIAQLREQMQFLHKRFDALTANEQAEMQRQHEVSQAEQAQQFQQQQAAQQPTASTV